VKRPYEETLLSDVDLADHGADIENIPPWVFSALLRQAKASYEAGLNKGKLIMAALREGVD